MFGSVTFRDKAHSFAVTLPVRPPGYKMDEKEIRDALEFQWPPEVTWEFHEFINIRMQEFFAQHKKGN